MRISEKEDIYFLVAATIADDLFFELAGLPDVLEAVVVVGLRIRIHRSEAENQIRGLPLSTHVLDNGLFLVVGHVGIEVSEVTSRVAGVEAGYRERRTVGGLGSTPEADPFLYYVDA